MKYNGLNQLFDLAHFLFNHTVVGNSVNWYSLLVTHQVGVCNIVVLIF